MSNTNDIQTITVDNFQSFSNNIAVLDLIRAKLNKGYKLVVGHEVVGKYVCTCRGYGAIQTID